VAWDADAAVGLWDAHVDEALPEVVEVPPATTGVYGTLDGIDWDRQAVAVWYDGQSSGCPSYVVDVTTATDVEVRTSAVAAGGCPEDWNAYRVLLVIDRDKLPDPAALPITVPEDASWQNGTPADVVEYAG